MSNDDLGQMQSEWRAIVLSKLNSLENGQNQMQRDISAISTTCASVTDLRLLQEKVEHLESWKAKATGIVIAFNIVAVFLGWLIQSYIFAQH